MGFFKSRNVGLIKSKFKICLKVVIFPNNILLNRGQFQKIMEKAQYCLYKPKFLPKKEAENVCGQSTNPQTWLSSVRRNGSEIQQDFVSRCFEKNHLTKKKKSLLLFWCLADRQLWHILSTYHKKTLVSFYPRQ